MQERKTRLDEDVVKLEVDKGRTAAEKGRQYAKDIRLRDVEENLMKR
jgi:hypothetical protein